MPQLNLSLLGPFLATVKDKPLTRFRTKTAQALLIYLTCERQVAHRREHLMTLLWPGLPQKSAQGSLRQSLYLLRKHIPEIKVKTSGEIVPFLLADNQSIQVNPEAEVELDVRKFKSILMGPVDTWSTAVSLYRGDFLADFYLPDSAPFEEWVLGKREVLRRQVLAALEQLAEDALVVAEFETAQKFARRQIEIDNLSEAGYRLLMQALTLSGMRVDALTQYEVLAQLMAQELGAKPSTETTNLYEAILAEEPIDGIRLKPVKKPAQSLNMDAAFPFTGPAPPRSLFVGREEELERLLDFWAEANNGHGQVAFIAGDAGSGKSSLLVAFAEKASQVHKEMLVVWGACNAFSGRGDPYLPFSDALSLLSGDIERAWAAGLLTPDQARNLWQAMPTTIQALSNHGPDLLDTMIPLPPLLNRIEANFPANQPLLSTLTDRSSSTSYMRDLEQPQLFEQVVALLHHLAKERPLLILLDDLQWADSGSIALLFHLGRRLAGGRILIIGAYRQDEVTAVADHPLRPLLDEFRRTFGDVLLDLNQALERSFVDAIIDSEANQLDETFRETLYRQTAGHPLFTVELLRDIQERGNLVRDEGGAWIPGQLLDWKTLPARVEGVIASRIGRLEEGLRQILTVAAVEGEYFTAQVVAQVQGLATRELVQQLSREADKQHHLAQAQGWLRLGSQRLSQYHFRHNLIQKYLYNHLDQVERAYIHEAVGNALEELYGEQAEEIAVQLARHFEEAGITEKAVPYHIQAGHAAKAQYAHEAAIEHYQKAVALLKAQNDLEQAAQISMQLGLVQHQAFDFQGAQVAYEEAFAFQKKSGRKQPAPAAVGPPSLHRLRFAWGYYVSTLDPAFANDVVSMGVINQLFSGLVVASPELGVMPEVAQSWEVLEGGTKYIFHLRDDVTWSDGQPVTAEDFAYAWKRVLAPATGSPVANHLFDIKGARAFHRGDADSLDQLGVYALNEATLVVTLEEPTSYFLQLLAASSTFAVPRHIVNRYGEAWTATPNIVTNGAFRLESVTQGQSIILARNPTYYGRFEGNVERVKISILSDGSAGLAAYQADELDILELKAFSQAQMTAARQRYAQEYIALPEMHTLYVGFDASRPPFDDPRVRQAFVMAIDRDRWASETEQGFVSPATGGFVPPAMPGHSTGIGLPFNPVQARHLLAEAGFPGGRGFPAVNLLWHDAPRYARQCEQLRTHWQANLGVDVTWETLEWSAYLDSLERELPSIFILRWGADYPDPDDFLRVGTRYIMRVWRSEPFLQLLEEARRTLNQTARLKLYHQADRLLIEDAALMPLYYDGAHLLVKPWVSNFPSPMHMQEHDWLLKDVIIEPH